MAQFPFVGAAYRARSKNFNAERCINLYPELGGSAQTAKNVAVLYGTPGLRLWLTLDGGGIRGCLRFSATVAVVVAGQDVYTVSSVGVATLRGTIAGANAIVSMASNGTNVMIVAGNTGCILNPVTGLFASIIDTDFAGADTVQFIDGYFAFNKPDTGQFQISSIYGTDFDALDFATAEGAPDLLLSLLVDHRELWLFGETSTEVFFNSGAPDMPFERINGAFIEQGCAAKFSPAKMDNTVYWLASDERGIGTVQRAQGYQPQRVSDHGVEYAIAQMSRIDDAIAYTYQQEGHSFYVLTFPTAQQTWVYDSSVNLWHERAWRNPVDGDLERHRAQCQMSFMNKTIVGDWETGKLYYLELDTFTDNEDPIARVRVCPHLSSPDYQYQFHASLQVDMQTGVGLSGLPAAAGVDPQARLRWSDDGGHSWSNELWAPIGAIGETSTRVKWRRLGRTRDRVYEVTITDPVRVAMIGASVLVTTGAS